MSGQNDSDEENQVPKRRVPYALELVGRKKPCQTDPLVHHGRHFGRTIRAMCNIYVLLTNGILRMSDEDYDIDDPNLPSEEQRENTVFQKLLAMVPGLEERLFGGDCSEEQLRMIADALQKGVNGSRADDTKTLKGPVIDLISTPGVPLNPPLGRGTKVDRGFNHDITGALLCPANLDWKNPEVREKLKSGDHVVSGDQWPICLYKDYSYDPEDPWKGLLRSRLMILAYKHVFTSPSSVEREHKATRSGNARIHGMSKVTAASLAYVATQLRFALSSSSIFSRTDKATDSQRFYSTMVDFLEDPEEKEEVGVLISFWNRQIFPEYACSKRPLTRDTVLSKLKAKRAALRAMNGVQARPN